MDPAGWPGRERRPTEDHVQLELGKLLDLDPARLPANSPKVPVHLHAKPRVRRAPPRLSRAARAISGDTPLCAFKRSDRAFRVTPRCSAASLTVRPKRLQNRIRGSLLPDGRGCALSFFGPFRRSMVVDQIKVDHILAVEGEDNPPIARHPKPPIVPCALPSGDEALKAGLFKGGGTGRRRRSAVSQDAKAQGSA